MKLKMLLSTVLAGCMMITGAFSGNIQPTDSSAVVNKARVSVHDPSVLKDSNGTYYIFGSHIDAAKSNDLQNWYTFTNGYTPVNNKIFGNLSQNLSKAFSWAGENLEDCDGGFSVWAPDVIYNPDYINKDGSKGAYLMYFCTTSTYKRSVICYGVSQKAEGPYELVDTLIYSGFWNNDSWVTSKDGKKKVNRKYTSTNIDELIAAGKVTMNNSWFSSNGDFNNQLFPNAIDPTIYYSPDGRMWMTYGSWSGGIFTIEIDKKTGQCIHPKSGKTSDGRMVDSYFGTKISGGYGKSGEGPFIEYNEKNGYYYLWVTYGGLTSEGGYNMRVFRSKNPDGPYVDAAGRSAVLGANTNLDSIGLKVMGNYKFSCLNQAYMAPGHNSVLKDDNGKWYLLNHTRFDDGYEIHQVRVHDIYFSSDDWPVVSPFEYSGDAISEGGYSESDITGEYEFINHGTDTSKTIHNYVNIKLNADGTISGGATGTWSQAENSPQASFNIGGQKYNGVFLAQQDESGKEHKVMTFTAVGSNNQTIWGAQIKSYTGSDRTAAIFKSGSTYRFKNVNSGLYMQVEGAKAENSANVQQWGSDAANTHDIWKLISAGDGYYYIASALGDGGTYMLDVQGKKADNGTNIEIYNFNGADNQKFALSQNSDGSYKIRTKISNKQSAVEIINGSVESGANVQQWEINGANCQDWILEEVTNPGCKMDTSVMYTFTNVNSNFVMDIADGKMENNSNVQQWESNGFDCQKWTLQESAENENYYYIRSVSDSEFALKAGSSENGGNIVISKFAADDSAMLFKFSKNPDGTYYIHTKASDDACYVEIEAAKTDMGANIQQWEPTDNDCQKWAAETMTTAPTTAPPTTTTQPVPDSVNGDVNADGVLNVADLVMMQKWLLGSSDELTNWNAGDAYKDGRIDVYDLIMIRKLLIG